MKVYKTSQIRNIAIVGHAGTGKSTLLDSLLFISGAIPKIGSHIDDSLISDFDIEEKKKKMSIHTAMAFAEFNDYKINIIDCPGHADLIGERRAAIQACDAAIIVIDSVDGVQVGTEKVWRYLNELKKPRIVFINKMDQERANYEKIIENVKTNLGAHLVSLCLPMGIGASLEGVVDIVEMKSMMLENASSRKIIRDEIPEEYLDEVKNERLKAIEIAAEGDNELVELFLEGKEFDAELIKRGIKEQIIENKLCPVICGSSLKAIGVKNLLHTIIKFMPSPEEMPLVKALDLQNHGKEILIKHETNEKLSAIVWKTYIDQYAGRSSYVRVISGELIGESDIYNSDLNTKERISKVYTMKGKDAIEIEKLVAGDMGAILKLEKTITGNTICDSLRPVKLQIMKLPEPIFFYAIKATDKKDEEKLAQIIAKYCEQYPTLSYHYNSETKQSVLGGMGQLHLDLTLEEIKDKFKMDFQTSIPRTAYRETINKEAEGHYKHKKQSGGHGQYAEVYIRISPLERGKGFEFTESIIGGAIPKNFIPAVEKGIRESLLEGVIAGYPVVDVKVELYDGTFHDVDSSEMAFRIAAANAFKIAMQEASPNLLEPMMNVKIYVDKDFMGDVMGNITTKRGRVLGMDSRSDSTNNSINVISAIIPFAEMQRYSVDLTQITQNKAAFEMAFSYYETVNQNLAGKIIEERKKMLTE